MIIYTAGFIYSNHQTIIATYAALNGLYHIYNIYNVTSNIYKNVKGAFNIGWYEFKFISC